MTQVTTMNTKPNATVLEIRAKIEAARARLALVSKKDYAGTSTGRELSSKLAYEQHLRNTTNKLPRNSGANCGFLDGEQK